MCELVSIIMPSYNTADYICSTIKSVLAQTYTTWELIIIDDCSTDNTDDIVKPFLEDKRIIYIKNSQNSGAALSRNHGLRLAKGEWVAFLDSDDLWLPEKLERHLSFMKKNNYMFSFTDYRICANGEWLPYIQTGPQVVTRRKLFDYCFFFTSTVIYNRSFVGLIQIADMKKNNDYAMWFEISKKSPCYRFPECLSYYIKHERSISGGSKFKLIKYHYLLYRKALNFNPLISSLLTINNLFWGVYKKIHYRTRTDQKPLLPNGIKVPASI